MARQVQLRRGTAVQHDTFTGVIGELTMNTTNNSLRLHDGATVGGFEMLKSDLSNAILSAASVFSLLDENGNTTVKITNVANPVDNQDVATKAYVDANGGGAVSIDDLTDVDTSTNPPVIGQFLKWDGNNWIPDDVNVVGSINDLNDVDITGIVNGQLLKWNGASFVPVTLSLSDLSDGNTVATLVEINQVESSIGLNPDGTRPNYSGAPHNIANTDTIMTAINKLDVVVHNNISKLSALDTSIGATDGVKGGYTSTNYISDDDNVVEALSTLDGELATKIDVNDVATTGANKVLRLDGAGKLSSSLLDGALPAISGASLTGVTKPLTLTLTPMNYTSQSNHLYLHYNIENLLVTLHDTASNGDTFYIQLAPGFERLTLGTTNVSVVYKGEVYSNPNPAFLYGNPCGSYELRYIDDGNTPYWYVNPLNSSLHTLSNVDINGIANGQTIIWNNITQKFEPSDIVTNTTAIQQEIDDIETTLGGYIDGNGDWVQPNGTEYIDTASSFSDALDQLDTAITTKLSTVDFTNASIKAKLDEDITGLNADMVDGIQGANLVTLNGVQTITGNKTFTGSVDLTGATATVITNPLANGNEVASATFVRGLIAGAGAVTQLDDLTDVVITEPATIKQSLIHDGTTFVNRELEIADLSDGNTLATTTITDDIQDELDTTQLNVGLGGDGSLPVYTSTHYINDNDSHHVSIGNLDNALANTDANITALSIVVNTKLPSADFTATNIKNLVNADNSGLNADLLDGLHSTAFVQVSSLDTEAGNVLGAIPTLDANGHIKTTQLPDLAITHVDSGLLADRPAPSLDNEGDIYITTDTFQTFISTGTSWSEILNPNATSLVDLQTELDEVETSLGLGADGSRPVYSSINYITNLDSHHVAIGKLDTQIKSNTDSLGLLGDASLLDDTDIFLVANALNEIAADNLAKSNARTNLGLGSSATLDVGTANGNVVQLGANGLPAISGQNLTALGSIDTLSDVDLSGGIANGQFIAWDGTKFVPANANSYTDEEARDAVGTALANGNHVGISFSNNDLANTIEAVVSIASTNLTDTANVARLDATQTFTSNVTFSATSYITTPAGAVGNEIASATFVRGLIAGAGGVTQLDDLADVVINNPTADKQVLIHNGTTFVNRIISSADLSDVADLATVNYVDTEITALNLGSASTKDAGTDVNQVLVFNVANELPVLSGVNLTGVVLSTEKGANSGVATLDVNGKLLTTQLPLLAITSITQDLIGVRPAASNDNEGDIYVATDENKTYVSGGAVTGWVEILTPFQASIDPVQTELDQVESSIGLNTNGTRPNYSGAPHNILNTDTIMSAVNKLDVAIHTNSGKLSALDTSIGATNGVKSNYTSTNYIDSGESIVDSLSALDGELVNKLDSATYTATDILTKIKTVDGAGSGLDADTVDGIQGANIATLDATTNTFTGSLKIAGNGTQSISLFNGVFPMFSVSGAGNVLSEGTLQVSGTSNLGNITLQPAKTITNLLGGQVSFGAGGITTTGNINGADITASGALSGNSLTITTTSSLGIATATSPNAGDDSTRVATTAWVQDEIAGFNPIASLDDLTDVALTAPINANQVLKYDGADWVNSQLASTELSDTADLIRVGDTSIVFSESGLGADTTNISVGGTIKFAGATNETVVSLDTLNNEFIIGLAENVEIQGDLTIGGDLTVNGSVTSINTTNLDIKDSMILLSDGTIGAPVNDSGFIIARGTEDNASLFWDEGNNRFEFITATSLSSLTTDVSATGGTITYTNVKMGGLITDSISPISGTLTLNNSVILTQAPALGDDSNLVPTTAWVQNEIGALGGVNSLDDLNDVILGGVGGVALAIGQTLRYDGSTFRNKKLEVGDLNNVTIGALTDGQVLRSNGTSWSNSLLSVTDLSDGNLLARLNNPNFTGIPTAPTAINGTNTTQLATTAFVNSSITALNLGNMAYEDITSFLQVANNLSDLDNTTTARTNLGLGNVATLNTGTGLNQVLKFTVADTLPAISGANLTSLGSINTLSDVTTNAPTNVQVLKWHNTEWINTQLASTDLNDSGDLARLASPALTGNPTAPTQPANTNDTTIATTAFVQQEISNASVGDLSNVDLTNNANGKVLQYNGADFVPVALATTDISGLGTSATYDAGTGANQVLLLDVAGTLPVLSGENLTGVVLSTDYEDSDILSKLLNVDGDGSLLDADLLDGLHSTSFLQVDNNLSDLNNTTTARTNLGLGSASTKDAGTGADQVLLLSVAGTLPVLSGENLTGVVKTSEYTANDVLAKLLTVDGDGSLLDADLLDGSHKSAFLLKADDLDGLNDPATARTNLGLGNVATYNAGTGAGEVLLLTNANELPALSGANLTSLPSISTLSDVNVNTNTITEGQLLSWNDTSNEFVARSVGDLSNVVLDNRNTTFSAELRATTQASNNDSTLVATTEFVQNVLSGAGLNPNDFFQLVNLLSELNTELKRSTARSNLGLGTSATYDVGTSTPYTIPLLDSFGRTPDTVDYGSVADAFNANVDFAIDYQNAGIDGATPLNAEELFQEVLIYADEDYGCLIS